MALWLKFEIDRSWQFWLQNWPTSQEIWQQFPLCVCPPAELRWMLREHFI